MTDKQTDDTVAEDETIDTEVAARDERRAALDTERDAANAISDGGIVEQRTADTDATKAASKVPDSEHVKVFVIPGDETKPTKTNYDHEPNIAATRQYMLNTGLRPTGEVEFKGAEPFGPGGKSWALTYAVPASPPARADFTDEVHVIQGDGGAEGEKLDDDDDTKTAD